MKHDGNTVIVGVAGGSGSGKTTVARRLAEVVDADRVVLLAQDAYYKDQSHLSFEERCKLNYDHPLSFDNELLVDHLKLLREGKGIQVPVYDYENHARSKETLEVAPKILVVVEGILVLEDANLRDMMDIKIYVDTDADERFIRRLKRDIVERGRSLDSVVEQYLGQVRPMHQQFVEPTKKYADLILPLGGDNTVAIDVLSTKMLAIMEEF